MAMGVLWAAATAWNCGIVDGRFNEMVVHDVRGRDDACGNCSGICSNGGLCINFNEGSFY